MWSFGVFIYVGPTYDDMGDLARKDWFGQRNMGRIYCIMRAFPYELGAIWGVDRFYDDFNRREKPVTAFWRNHGVLFRGYNWLMSLPLEARGLLHN